MILSELLVLNPLLRPLTHFKVQKDDFNRALHSKFLFRCFRSMDNEPLGN